MSISYHDKYLKYKAKYLKLKSLEQKIIMKGGSNNTPTLYLFKAEWCPHCVAFKPVWKDLQEGLKNKMQFVAYDADKDSKEVKEFKIDGFPTLILKTNNKAIEYVGPRDKTSIEEFIKQYN